MSLLNNLPKSDSSGSHSLPNAPPVDMKNSLFKGRNAVDSNNVWKYGYDSSKIYSIYPYQLLSLFFAC